HVRVLDLSRIIAAPWAGQILGDLGAEVIKLERPGAGDEIRKWGPPYLPGENGARGDSVYYTSANRNKKSVTIDFTQPEGQRLVRELAARSDVVLENFKMGSLRRYGLDYDALRALNPRIIYCSVTGFGQEGPYAPRAGYDALVQAFSGLMATTGRPDGEPGAGPIKCGIPVSDILTGLYATIAVLAALAYREVSGIGQRIDMALLDSQVACLANQALTYLHTGSAPRRMGNDHPNVVPYRDFPTADGQMMLAIGGDDQFARFARVAGHPEWASDPRFAVNAERVRHRHELLPMIAAVTATRTTRQWVEALEPEGVPCGPIHTLPELFADAHVRARGLAITMRHPLAGDIPLLASPIRLSATPVQYRIPPPTLGQHTREVLEDLLGLDARTIDELRERKVV
ncbi:MAG TPA: CaiB/BaiF CoA-transferase family protein, partial [Myxococcaceae bacterium]|nr:CaiB/BaiF CoA-transferase family protein [Myxococcaceae bacterium]